jgi:undecaprenyl-diphosphatase
LELLDLVILGLVEGVADILPIDATGHSLLLARLVGWRAGTIGVSIHLGAALALLTYLWREVGLIGTGLWKLRRLRIEPGTRLLGLALLTAAPWIIANGLMGTQVPRLTDLAWVGAITILCAVLMGVADRLCMTVRRIEHMSAAGALLLGLVQLLALVPGVGRVAAAVTMGRLLGLERLAAYRFILLSSVPALLAAGGKSGVTYFMQGIRPTGTDILTCGITYALVLMAVSIAMSWLRRVGLLPFTVYRLMIGVLMVALAVL